MTFHSRNLLILKNITDNNDEGLTRNNLVQGNLQTDDNLIHPKNKEEDVTTTKSVLNGEDIIKHDDSYINKYTRTKPLASDSM